jgi:CubicO group peptidase (beta-lactamase class C family)
MPKLCRIQIATTLAVAAALIAPARAFPATTTRQPSPAVWAGEIEKLRRRGEVPGLSIAVIRDGKIGWKHAFGQKNAIKDGKTDGPVHDDTLFPAASLSKPIFAYLALRLGDRGTLDLDKPLYEYLPNKRLEQDDRYKLITARMILSHTSGLPNWGGTPLRLLFTPGERWSYSSEGYMYLQAVVEKLTGQSLEALAQKEVFGPLQMRHSTYAWSPAVASNLVSGDSGLVEPQVIHDSTAGAAYSLLTTAEDYARFVIAVIEGTGLKKETSERMLTPQVETHQDGQPDKQGTPSGAFWGLGWGLEESHRGPYFWHVGDTGGFKCFVIASRAKREGMVVFTNSLEGFSIVDPLVTMVLNEHHPLMDWGGFKKVRYDNPGIVAKRELIQVFNGHGTEIGVAHYRAVRKKSPEIVDEYVTNELAYYLRNHGKMDAAIAIFKENAQNYPKSINTYDSLAVTYLFAGQLDRATDTWEKASELEPASRERQERIAWMREYIHGEKEPVRIPLETLQRYVGNFKDRQITLNDGSLYCEETASKKSFRLIPLSNNSFAEEGDVSVRLSFTPEKGDKAYNIVVSHMP